MAGSIPASLDGRVNRMTYAELQKQILNLGFETKETYDEEPSIMVDAINRAMREITNLFPLVGKYKIAQNPLPNLLENPLSHLDVKHYDGKTELVYVAEGAKSLYFACSGSGTLTIEDDEGTKTLTLESNRAFKEYRAFVSGSVTLTFGGIFAYDVKNIAVYGQIYSQTLSDIPAYRPCLRYDFRELTRENDKVMFIEFMDKVEEGNYSDGLSYVSIKDFTVEERHILVLDGFKKLEYTIFYKKNFTPFTATTLPTFEIELDYDQEHLLPLLAAWYVWADDEPQKAAKWKNDYEDFASRLLSAQKSETAQEKFVNDLGW